jgi:hypothetical protein
MKTTLLYLFIYLSAHVFDHPADWYTYQSQEIIIEFPKEPELTSQSVPTAVGDIEMKIASYDGSKEGDINLAYVFISSNYPDSLINSNKKEMLPDFFRSSIDGAVKNVNGKLIAEKEIMLDAFPGREAKVDYGNGQVIILFRMYLVQNRAYFIQTISEAGKEENESALRFRNSFKLKK